MLHTYLLFIELTEHGEFVLCLTHRLYIARNTVKNATLYEILFDEAYHG